jgi:hypothetical protein
LKNISFRKKMHQIQNDFQDVLDAFMRLDNKLFFYINVGVILIANFWTLITVFLIIRKTFKNEIRLIFFLLAILIINLIQLTVLYMLFFIKLHCMQLNADHDEWFIFMSLLATLICDFMPWIYFFGSIFFMGYFV